MEKKREKIQRTKRSSGQVLGFSVRLKEKFFLKYLNTNKSEGSFTSNFLQLQSRILASKLVAEDDSRLYRSFPEDLKKD